MYPKNEEKKMEIYRFINDFLREYRVCPKIEEIAEGVNLSKSTTHKFIVRLEEEGYIERFGKNQMTTRETMWGIDNIPMVGSVACGKPKFAEEDIQGYLPVNKDMLGYGEFFGLIADGESMKKVGISSGDIVIVRKQNTADEGQIVVALVLDEYGYDNTATLKRYYIDRDINKIRLHPENDEMSDFYADNIRILGVAVKVLKNLETE